MVKAKKRYEYRGRMMTVPEIANETGIPKQTIYWRVLRNLPPVDESRPFSEQDCEDWYEPKCHVTEDTLDLGGCWLLAASALRLAYEDVANLEMLEILRDDPCYSKNIIHKKQVMIRQAERKARTDLKGREYTEDEFKAWASRRLIAAMKEIETNGKSAIRFLESDRAEIFCHDADPRAIIDKARERVRLWADGKSSTYHLKGAS